MLRTSRSTANPNASVPSYLESRLRTGHLFLHQSPLYPKRQLQARPNDSLGNLTRFNAKGGLDGFGESKGTGWPIPIPVDLVEPVVLHPPAPGRITDERSDPAPLAEGHRPRAGHASGSGPRGRSGPVPANADRARYRNHLRQHESLAHLPTRAAPVVPAEAKPWAGAPIQPPAPIAVPREEPKPPPQPVIESRTIILAGYAGPFSQQQPGFYPSSAPWLAVPPMMPQMPTPQAIPAAPAQPAQPTVVVIREPVGEPRPVFAAPAPAEQPRGVTIGNEMLLGIGIGVAGLGFGFAGCRRRAVVAGTKQGSPLPFSPLGGDGMLLMGKYNAGPLPTTAEKFDLGPSYADRSSRRRRRSRSKTSRRFWSSS